MLGYCHWADLVLPWSRLVDGFFRIDCMRKTQFILIWFGFAFLIGSQVCAQEKADTLPEKSQYGFSGDEAGEESRPLVIKLSDDGKKYVRFILWGQIWARALQNNPGTLGVDGRPVDWTTDIGIRRARMLAYASVSPRFLIMLHFGINNQTFMNGGVAGGGDSGNAGLLPIDPNVPIIFNDMSSAKKPQMFIHDIWNEFKVTPELYIGAGLHYWNGVSRLSSAGTLNFLTMDAPIFNWGNIELTDQFARQFGFYAKGQIRNWDYRVALNKPFSVGSGGTFDPVRQRPIAFNDQNDNWATQGYIAYQFWEHENNKLPFFVGSYLGDKKVFNVGGGWHHHPQATSSIDQSGVKNRHDIGLLGMDVFLDLPLHTALGISAITFYGVAYRYDFGPNYIRNIGIMNTGLGRGTTQNGPGNSQPMIGTGNIFYFQSGYMLPKKLMGNLGGFQPFGSLTVSDFEYFDQAAMQYSLGFNYLISDHRAKLSLEYRRRPYFENFLRTGGAGELILQTHIIL